MLSPRADENAAVVFDDLASAVDAGLPLESLGGDASLGDRVLIGIAQRRGVVLSATEQLALEVGWRSGRGATTLTARAADRRRRAEFVRSVWRSLSYPLLLFVMLLVASIATMAIIGPQVAIAIGCSYAGLTVLIVWLARKLARGDAALERWPLIGNLLVDLRELPYLETLHALYGAGIPILQAHTAAVASVKMQGLHQRLIIADNLLQLGQPLRDALTEAAALAPETRSLLATGEQAGQLEDALHRALLRRQQVATQKLTKAARRVGQIAYSCAVVGVVVILYLFYSRYFAMWRR